MLTPRPEPGEEPLAYVGRLLADDTKFTEVVLGIVDEDAMRAFFDGYVASRVRVGMGRGEAERHSRYRIGYVQGEGMAAEVRYRWHHATGISHPFFGLLEPTANQALHAGMDYVEFQKNRARPRA